MRKTNLLHHVLEIRGCSASLKRFRTHSVIVSVQKYIVSDRFPSSDCYFFIVEKHNCMIDLNVTSPLLHTLIYIMYVCKMTFLSTNLHLYLLTMSFEYK